VGPARFEVTLGAEVGHDALRQLADQSCGNGVWLGIGHAIPKSASHGPAAWCALPVPDDRIDGEPDLVLACWSKSANRDAGVDRTRLRMAARMIASATRAASVFEYLLDQTSRDPLTGLLNRRGIFEALEREVARAGRSTSCLTVLFLDLDNFKEINDRYGHAAGDRVLTSVAQQLSRMLRASDSLGRIGGDEFLAILPDTELRAAYRIGNRLARKVLSTSIPLGSSPLRVSLTYGAASSDEERKGSSLVDRADRRMLLRKRRKRATTKLGLSKPAAVASAQPSEPIS
jgi:diguanylate cyclase (GGDEF)-like protein